MTSAALSHHLDSLKDSLLGLSPTGNGGFEGLMAGVLTDITGLPFRLSASGSQFGRDGTAVNEDDGVVFECKLYRGRIPKDTIVSRIAELPVRSSDVEAWFLCATSEVSDQTAEVVREVGRRSGIATHILDWSGALPPLAVALAVSTEATRRRFDADASVAVDAALAAIRTDRHFDALAQRLRRDLQEPLVGTVVARHANVDWLTTTFASRRRATLAFGQPLSPLDRTQGPARVREDLVARVQRFLTGEPGGATLCVHGGEGTGKSWLVAHSWCLLARRPLMTILNLRPCQAVIGPGDCLKVLASTLPAQTGDEAVERVVGGWCRKFNRWSNGSRSDQARLVAVIDGVNQHPQADWGRIIDAFDDALHRIGGRLIVTSRTVYYETALRLRCTSVTEELCVPEWTATERDAILAANALTPASLDSIDDANPAVGQSLLNPRMLGIAVRLLKGKTVERPEELSVPYLLFEHLRTREQDSPVPEPAKDCVHRLGNHAQEILTRLRLKRHDDLTVFDQDDAQAVVDERYFVPVAGDPARYSLRENGLPVAFGFLVLDRLRAASRNGRSVVAELGAVLEPIAPLDRTADVVMAALTCACIDESQSDETAVALVLAFVELQNLNHDDLAPFRALARRRSSAFLEAARRMCLTGWRQPHCDWIEAVLRSTRGHPEASRNVQLAVRDWFAQYSLSPENGVRWQGELSAGEKAKRKKKIDDNLRSLSNAERRLLDGMVETEGDVQSLFRLGLTVIAGGPIEPFAKGIAQLCLASILNQNGLPCYDLLEHVVRLNRVDWSAARAALLQEGIALRGANASGVGTWALITLLRATGDQEDASEADKLTARISDFRPKEWRLVENYCSVDPCDPSTSRPTNVEATVQKYKQIDATALYGGEWKAGDDHFLEMARPGVARFDGDVAVNKHRQFIVGVLDRRGLPLKRGLLHLRPHSALVTTDMAATLANGDGDLRKAIGDLPEGDRWVVEQQSLLLAFPRLTAEEQVKALLGTRMGEDVLRPLVGLMKPLEGTGFDRYFQTACQGENARHQYCLLVFANGSGTPMSRESRDCIAELATSQSALVRMAALERSFRLQDERLMRFVVDGGWRADKSEGRNSYENAYGAAILVEGVLRNWISAEAALERMSAEHWGWAARRLGTDAARTVAELMERAVGAAVGERVDDALPEVEYGCRQDGRPESEPYRLGDRARGGIAARAWVRRKDRETTFEEQERMRQEAFEACRRKLERANAGIVLDDLAKEDLEAIVEAAPEVAERWHGLFASLGGGARRTVHNLMVMLAYGWRTGSPGRTVELLRAVYGEKGLVSFTEGRARMPLEAVVAWSAAGSEPGREWCQERLDRARNDHELATEVLAASWSGQDEALHGYIGKRLGRGEPEGIARALLVAGFSGQDQRNEELIRRHRSAKGFVGQACKAAKYAHDRDGWARAWFEKMCEADTAEEFWRYSVLFTKIVDGRFTLWGREYTSRKEPMRLYASSVDGEVDRRIEKWREHRGKTLFGGRKPADELLPGRRGEDGDEAGTAGDGDDPGGVDRCLGCTAGAEAGAERLFD